MTACPYLVAHEKQLQLRQVWPRGVATGGKNSSESPFIYQSMELKIWNQFIKRMNAELPLILQYGPVFLIYY